MSGMLQIAGVSTRSAGQVLAAILEASRRPATEVLQSLSGATLRLEVLSRCGRPLTDREQFRLQAARLALCHHRAGLLVTADGMTAASVSLTWLPARLPWEACQALDGEEEPAGVILDRLPGGMRREDRRATGDRVQRRDHRGAAGDSLLRGPRRRRPAGSGRGGVRDAQVRGDASLTAAITARSAPAGSS